MKAKNVRKEMRKRNLHCNPLDSVAPKKKKRRRGRHTGQEKCKVNQKAVSWLQTISNDH